MARSTTINNCILIKPFPHTKNCCHISPFATLFSIPLKNYTFNFIVSTFLPRCYSKSPAADLLHVGKGKLQSLTDVKCSRYPSDVCWTCTCLLSICLTLKLQTQILHTCDKVKGTSNIFLISNYLNIMEKGALACEDGWIFLSSYL